MAKKHKKSPVKVPLVENVHITEIERLQFMIRLNENVISPSDFETDNILREQIEKLKARIADIEAEELGILQT